MQTGLCSAPLFYTACLFAKKYFFLELKAKSSFLFACFNDAS